MTSRLVSVPTERGALDAVKSFWFPHAESLARRFRLPASQIEREIREGMVQIHLVIDGETCPALAGTRIVEGPQGRICELIWTTGSRRVDWQHHISGIEAHARKWGCQTVKAICRPGWRDHLAGNGFKMTHLVMEKGI